MKAQDFTDQQKIEFMDEFYNLMENPLDKEADCQTENPWGCPWFWYGGNLMGNTVADMAKNFLMDQLDAIELALHRENEE